jgi:hypothetical protein
MSTTMPIGMEARLAAEGCGVRRIRMTAPTQELFGRWLDEVRDSRMGCLRVPIVACDDSDAQVIARRAPALRVGVCLPAQPGIGHARNAGREEGWLRLWRNCGLLAGDCRTFRQ